jgi:hypothetical protein
MHVLSKSGEVFRLGIPASHFCLQEWLYSAKSCGLKNAGILKYVFKTFMK